MHYETCNVHFYKIWVVINNGKNSIRRYLIYLQEMDRISRPNTHSNKLNLSIVNHNDCSPHKWEGSFIVKAS